jgi:hypothetical protein
LIVDIMLLRKNQKQQAGGYSIISTHSKTTINCYNSACNKF